MSVMNRGARGGVTSSPVLLKGWRQGSKDSVTDCIHFFRGGDVMSDCVPTRVLETSFALNIVGRSECVGERGGVVEVVVGE